MLCNLVRIFQKVERVVVRAVSVLARTLGRRARRRESHSMTQSFSRMASDSLPRPR